MACHSNEDRVASLCAFGLCASDRRVSVSSWRGGARKPVVDRLAQALVRDRHDGDGGGVQRRRACAGAENRLAAASTRSPPGDRLSTRTRALGAGRQIGAERQQRLAGAHVVGVEPQPRPRRVVRGQHAGRERRVGVACRRRRRRAARRARARSSSRGRPPGRSSIGRSRQATMVEFDADRRRPAVDDQVDAAAQVGQHVRRGGRRDMAGAVGRRRHHRPAERAQDAARHRMVGHPHRDAVEAGGGKLGDRAAGALAAAPASAVPARTPRRAARPRRRTSPARRAAARSATCAISGLNDGPALGGIEPRDRRAVGGVGAEAVDRLGRERDQAAGGEAARRFGDGAVVGGEDAGGELGGHAAALRSCVGARLLARRPRPSSSRGCARLRDSAGARTAAPSRRGRNGASAAGTSRASRRGRAATPACP